MKSSCGQSFPGVVYPRGRALSDAILIGDGHHGSEHLLTQYELEWQEPPRTRILHLLFHWRRIGAGASVEGFLQSGKPGSPTPYEVVMPFWWEKVGGFSAGTFCIEFGEGEIEGAAFGCEVNGSLIRAFDLSTTSLPLNSIIYMQEGVVPPDAIRHLRFSEVM